MNDDGPLLLPSLGEYVQALRKRRGYSQADLKQAGLGLGTIRNIEQNQVAKLTDTVLNALVSILRPTADELAHLRALAGHSPEHDRIPIADEVAISLVTAFDPNPAACLSGWAVARTRAGAPMANAAFDRMWPGLSEAKTLLHWWFGDAEAMRRTPDWRQEVTILTGLFRHAAATTSREEAVAVLDELGDDPVFRQVWNSGYVCVARPHPRRRVWDPEREREFAVYEELLVWPQTSRRGLFLGVIG